MVNPSSAKLLYQELETWPLDQIRAGQESIALMAEIRELCGEDWAIEELTRAIIFDEVEIIEEMKKEAERARTVRKEFKRV